LFEVRDNVGVTNATGRVIKDETITAEDPSGTDAANFRTKLAHRFGTSTWPL
jgi:hypothetical protein